MLKAFVTLRRTFLRKKRKNQISIDVFQEYESFTFFGWFFRDNRVRRLSLGADCEIATD